MITESEIDILSMLIYNCPCKYIDQHRCEKKTYIHMPYRPEYNQEFCIYSKDNIILFNKLAK